MKGRLNRVNGAGGENRAADASQPQQRHQTQVIIGEK